MPIYIVLVPVVLRIENLIFLIWTKDHSPPHVHVRTKDKENEITLCLSTFRVTKKKGEFSARDLKYIREIAKKNLEILSTEWSAIHEKE